MNEFERVVSPDVGIRRRPAEPAQGPIVARTAEGVAAPLTPDSIMHLQRTAGNASVAGMLGAESEASPVQDFLAGSSGQQLEGGTRTHMEGALGADLSDVRIHRGGEASSSAASVQARAYTVGSDVVLGNDVNPTSGDGQKTLAHELTHVVQQRQGPVDGTPAGGGIRLSDPGDRFEQAAEASAQSIMSGGPSVAAAGGADGGATAQREGAEEEEELQMSPLQRAGEEEEEELQMSPLQREGAEEEEMEPAAG